jgi:hypothetical protein
MIKSCYDNISDIDHNREHICFNQQERNSTNASQRRCKGYAMTRTNLKLDTENETNASFSFILVTMLLSFFLSFFLSLLSVSYVSKNGIDIVYDEYDRCVYNNTSCSPMEQLFKKQGYQL